EGDCTKYNCASGDGGRCNDCGRCPIADGQPRGADRSEERRVGKVKNIQRGTKLLRYRFYQEAAFPGKELNHATRERRIPQTSGEMLSPFDTIEASRTQVLCPRSGERVDWTC